MVAASSGALESAPAVTTELSVCRAWRLQGGTLICSARGRSVLAVLGPPSLCLSRGEAGSWAVSRRPVLRSLCCWIRTPGRAAPSARSLFFCLSPSELLRVPPCALQPLGSSAAGCGALPGAQVSVTVPGSPRASPPSWGPALTPCEPLSAREGRCSSCVSGTGLSCPGDTRPGLSRALHGAPPPWRPFVSLFLFPHLPTLIEA